MSLHPAHKFMLAKRPRSESEHVRNDACIGCRKIVPVHLEERLQGDEPDTFVPVDERVILHDCDRVEGAERAHIRAQYLVGPSLLRTSDRAFEKPAIAKPDRPAEVRGLLFVNR